MSDISRTSVRLLKELSSAARRFVVVFITASSSLALLDLAALALLAVSLPSILAGNPIDLPGGASVPSSSYWIVLVTISALIIAKSMTSLLLQHRAARRFAKMQLELGTSLLSAHLRMPWVRRVQINSSQLVRTADVSVSSAVLGFLFQLVSLPAQLATLAAVLVVLIIAQPMTAVLTATYLTVVGVALYFLVAKRSQRAGLVNRVSSEATNNFIGEMVAAMKELTLRGTLNEAEEVVQAHRTLSTRAQAQIVFLNGLPKYVFEMALVGGFVLIGGVTLIIAGPDAAISAIVIFAVGGFRMVPSLAAMHSIFSIASSNLTHAERVLDDIDELKPGSSEVRIKDGGGAFNATATMDHVFVEGVSFTYPGGDRPALRRVSLSFPQGSHIAFVGESGSGKSTLLDVLLGLVKPDTGRVVVGQRELSQVLIPWQRKIGYVPQDVTLFDGSIAQNVALTWSEGLDTEKVTRALSAVQLDDLIEFRRGGIHESIGEGGLRISGGQRQRLGIARALYAEPSILVLDEATSALDTATEAAIMNVVTNIPDLTIIATAHRLATIKNFEQIFFLKEGELKDSGSFSQLVSRVPDFARQAGLAGLTG